PIVGRDLDQGHGHGGAQEFEYNGDRGGGGHAQSIEKIQEEDIGDHHRRKDEHDLVEIEFTRIEDALSDHFHQATGKNGTTDDPQTGNDQDSSERQGCGPECGIEEIDGIVADPDHNINKGKKAQDHHHHQEKKVHTL